jgi:hypothetical protein
MYNLCSNRGHLKEVVFRPDILASILCCFILLARIEKTSTLSPKCIISVLLRLSIPTQASCPVKALSSLFDVGLAATAPSNVLHFPTESSYCLFALEILAEALRWASWRIVAVFNVQAAELSNKFSSGSLALE